MAADSQATTSMEDCTEIRDYTLGCQVLCRPHQVKTLLSLFGQKQHMTPGCLFIYGHTGTGKSLVVQTIMTYYRLPHVLLNCIECSHPRFFFEHVLNNLPLQTVNKPHWHRNDRRIKQANSHMDEQANNHMDMELDNDSDDYIPCDNMTDFVRQLASLVSNSSLKEETLYLVLDKAERLRDVSLLPALLRLQELSGLNLCVILISEIVWEKFRVGTGFCEPYCLHFPDYSRQELMEIMILDAPTSCEKDLYSLYINIVLSVFHMVCRDLRELRHIGRLNYPYFIEPVEKDEVKLSDTKKLWRNIEPHLKRALRSVYLREISSRQWELIQRAALNDSESNLLKVTTSRSYVELPYYSKFLLIAAYLASYNPMKYDRRFFAKHSSKISKRSKVIKKNERTSNHLLGPKIFPVDRMMAIFYSIVEGKVVPSAHIYVQISSLVSLHLLCQIGGEDKITVPKYKCLVTLDFIQAIARTVNFDVMKYLYDFL